jgi:hypothetical protein
VPVAAALIGRLTGVPGKRLSWRHDAFTRHRTPIERRSERLRGLTAPAIRLPAKSARCLLSRGDIRSSSATRFLKSWRSHEVVLFRVLVTGTDACFSQAIARSASAVRCALAIAGCQRTYITAFFESAGHDADKNCQIAGHLRQIAPKSRIMVVEKNRHARPEPT